MDIYLEVAYDDRHFAKYAGAKWDARRRQWYVAEQDLKRYSYAFRMRKQGAARGKKRKWVQLELTGL